MLSLFRLVLGSAALVSASCWRNTTCSGPSNEAFPGSWSKYIYAHSSRLVSPVRVLTWPSLSQEPYSSSRTLEGNRSLITYDFGVEVGGIIRIKYNAIGSGRLGLAFSESKSFVGFESDSSTIGHATFRSDGAVFGKVDGNGEYVLPDENLRGGFRYLTLFLVTGSTLQLTPTNVSLEISFQPTWPNLRAYSGYFYSSDELLNQIWYAGAYTLQTNTVPPDTGRSFPLLNGSWANNATLGPGSSIIVDGAKRDRTVWPGDMGVAIPSQFVSIGDLESVKNGLQIMYDLQDKTTGALDESGPPLSQKNSDTYHMWTLIGTYNYFLYTEDTSFLKQNWDRYTRAVSYILGKVDQSGLLNVTGTRDWARWQQGFHNTEANMILYRTLMTGAKLATWQRETTLSTNWTRAAASLASAINEHTFSFLPGAYKDNDTATQLIPQDANALSLLFGVAPQKYIASIAQRLTNNWTPIGPEAPELPSNISPFISSFELQGRFKVRDTKRALELLRTTWGWIIKNENSTQSTLLEGYLTNGSFGYRNNRGYGYDDSYTSHAHGWSAGPTSALTNFVLGLDITEPAGREWSLWPQFGDLIRAEGGFTTKLGPFSVKWYKLAGQTHLEWNTPVGTKGVIGLPFLTGPRIKGLEGAKVSFDKTVFGEQLVTWTVKGGRGSVVIET